MARELTGGRLLRLGAVTAQFVLLVGALRLWNIESQAFERVAMLALGGFLVHHFLPHRLRLPFFAALSVASILMVFGVRLGTTLLAAGGLLIAICHLPIAFGWRAALLALVGVVYAVLRTAPSGLPAALSMLLPNSIWPILGSMFMFRLLVYAYDLRHGTAPVGFWRALAYFFMIPNVCCPLFPVVDYQTFCRNLYNDDAIHIYQLGTRWILRGIVQLMLYRFLYLRCMVDLSEVRDALDVGQYMLTTFLLYLKISGLFHFVIGLLHMFGFNLPETHHLYLLSGSFTDFWRRINIYWKDFITKLIFYPLYFRWRGRGEARAVVLATLAAFLATWILHSYQWFWIRGSFPIVWSDLVFWFGLGVVVVLNVRWEQRRGRRRTLRKVHRSLRSEVGVVLRTAGTFTAIVVLWTIWSTPSRDEILMLLDAASHLEASHAALLASVPLGIGVLGMLLGRRTREHTEGRAAAAVRRDGGFWPATLRVGAAAAALVFVALRPWTLSFAPDLAAAARDLRDRGLNQADQHALQRGYYEELGDVTRFDNQLWQLYGVAPKNWGKELDLMQERSDAVLYSYRPGASGHHKGAMFSINSTGLRDREYTRSKPDSVFRVALVGASHDVGTGVADAETYENVLEDLLNQQRAAADPWFEVLNFSAAGYSPVQKLAVSEIVVPDFEPDVVLYAAHSHEFRWTFYQVDKLVERGQATTFEFFAAALRQAGIAPEERLPRVLLERRLEPYARPALGGLLERFAAQVRAYGARPVLLLVEYPMDKQRPEVFAELAALGRDAGLDVIDSYGALSSVADRSTLWIAPWDDHTNALGHRLLAEKLLVELRDRRIVPGGGDTTRSDAGTPSPPPAPRAAGPAAAGADTH